MRVEHEHVAGALDDQGFGIPRSRREEQHGGREDLIGRTAHDQRWNAGPATGDAKRGDQHFGYGLFRFRLDQRQVLDGFLWRHARRKINTRHGAHGLFAGRAIDCIRQLGKEIRHRQRKAAGRTTRAGRRHRRQEGNGACRALFKKTLTDQAAHRMGDQYRRSGQACDGCREIVDVVVEAEIIEMRPIRQPAAMAGKLKRVTVVTQILEIRYEADGPQRGVAITAMDEKQRRVGACLTGEVVVNNWGFCGHLEYFVIN